MNKSTIHKIRGFAKIVLIYFSGCAVSLLLYTGFLSLQAVGATLQLRAQVSP